MVGHVEHYQEKLVKALVEGKSYQNKYNVEGFSIVYQVLQAILLVLIHKLCNYGYFLDVHAFN